MNSDVQLLRSLNDFPKRFRGGAVSVGNFDGVHRGHAHLIGRLVAMARHVQGPAVVFTFDPHPAQLLRPAAAPTPLGWTDRNVQLLGELHVDAVVAYPTDEAFLRLEAREFFEQVVRGGLGSRAMVEGANFFFGLDRSGDIDVLQGFCDEATIPLEVVEPLRINGLTVSSSRIRSLVSAGQVDEAHSLLSRPYRIRGTVVTGSRRGVTLGFPTANLERIDTLLPSEGIYAGVARVEETAHPAAVNVGPNPTFGEEGRKVEAYLVDFSGDLYGRTIEVDFLARLRDIRHFNSPETLVAQMQRDVAATRRIVEPYST